MRAAHALQSDDTFAPTAALASMKSWKRSAGTAGTNLVSPKDL